MEAKQIEESDVFTLIRKHDGLTVDEIITKLESTPHIVRKHLKALKLRDSIRIEREERFSYYLVTEGYEVPKENLAGPRTFEFKPLTGYDMTAGMRLAEGARNKETGYV